MDKVVSELGLLDKPLINLGKTKTDKNISCPLVDIFRYNDVTYNTVAI